KREGIVLAYLRGGFTVTYEEAVSWLQTMADIPQNQQDEDFIRIIPAMIDYAEGRIYRELDFLATLTSQTTTLNALNREFALPSTYGRSMYARRSARSPTVVYARR